MDEPLAEVLPLLEQLMTDNDRHKQRAAAEVIGGMPKTASRCLTFMLIITAFIRSSSRHEALAIGQATNRSQLAGGKMGQDLRKHQFRHTASMGDAGRVCAGQS